MSGTSTEASATAGRWRPYPPCKGSGVDWLGDIPKHWQAKRLKYCASIVNEKANAQSSELPYTGLEHIEPWTGKRVQADEKPEAQGQASTFHAGDVLFGKLRPYLAKVFRANEHGICTGELLVLRPQCVLREFLFYYMLAPDFISMVDASTYGAKMPRASWDSIGNLPALLPSDSEQRAIAAFLDRETGKIDALVAKKEELIRLLEEKRTALISHAVTKGLDPNAPMKDSGVPWLGKIPEHWEVRRLKYLASLVTGNTPPKSDIENYSDDGMPWVKPDNLAGTTPVLDSEEKLSVRGVSLARSVPEGTALVCCIGSVGTVGLAGVDLATNQQISSVVFERPRIWHARYGLYALIASQQEHRRRANSAVVSIINKAAQGSIHYPVPPHTEQKGITAFLDQQTDKFGCLIAKSREVIEKFQEYRTALISAAVTGKIDVRDEV